MEITKVADSIRKLISEIGTYRREIESKGKAKAKAISDYDRKIAITLAILRNSDSYELAGKTYQAPPVSIMEKIAKGICAEECYVKEIADSGYKATLSNLEALKAQLNAMQSIYRHLENV